MEADDLHPPDDFSHRFFIWHEWIQANGPLDTANAFEYFSKSMFYDKQSNNQVLRMQTVHTGVPIVNEAEELRRFTGIEFALVHADPPGLFIIHKRERLSPDEVRPLAAYFIMNNRIYQSPDVYTVLSNRLLTSLQSLQSSLDTLRTYKPDYTPRTGFVWPIADPSTADDASKKRGAGAPEDAPSQQSQPSSAHPDRLRQPTHTLGAGAGVGGEATASPFPRKLQNTLLLFNAMRTTAAHSNKPLPAHLSTTEGAPLPSSLPPASTTAGPASPAPVPQVLSSAAGGELSTTMPETPATPPEGAFAALKGPVPAAKKKRKRTLTLPPAPGG